MPESRRQKTSEAPAKSAAVEEQDKAMAEEGVTEEGLIACLERIATLTGHGNVLKEYGMKRWLPSKKDMRKYN